MKKLFGSLIALICVVACMLTLPIEANAATEGYYTYEVSDGQATITNVDTTISGAITIPSTLGGYPVTGIGSFAFGDCRSLTSVTVPDSVTSIGDYAFDFCLNLTAVTIPDSVSSIGNYAFSNCSSLTSVTIPDSVTNIGNGAFAGCSSLTSVTIGDSVTGIGDWTFASCSGLTSVTIPDSVTSIASNAFSNCSSLTSVTIGDSVTSISVYAFDSCSSLTGIWVDEGNQFYSSDNCGVLFNKDKTTLIALPGAHSGDYTIPDSVTSIGNRAFHNCSNLTSITIPDSVTSIGKHAFHNCSSLTSITIPDSVTSIGDYAFWFCTSLTSVTIGDGVTSIGNSAFSNCSSLTGVTIGNSVTSIGDYAFSDCTSLTSVTIPDSVTTIGAYAFRSCSSLTSVTIGDSVISIGNNAFHHCKNLTFVTIPDSVTSIGRYSFSDCSSLTSVTIGDSVISIGNNAFHNCKNLTFVTIPDSVTTIGAYAFRSCSSLTSVTIGDSVTSIGNSAFYYCTSLTSVTIPDGVDYIDFDMFANCTSLTSITIPDSVTSIGSSAFYNCSRLTSVTYCGTEEQWNAISIGLGNTPLINAERIRHNYVDQGVITMPTFTITGQQQKVCSVCSDTVTETLDMLVGEVSGWNVTLQDDLQVNFHLNISASIESTARVRIVVGEEGYTFRVSGLEKTEDGLYIASVHIAAAQMTDFIFVTVINGSDLAETASYTVRGYADTILADEDFSQYHQLVREMLNYGAAAQVYFDYEKDILANEGIANTGSVEIPDSVDNALSVAGNADGVTFYGASLIFRNKIAVRYYFQFKGDINDCSFTVNDTTYAPQLKDGLYYVEIADILPQNLDEEITLMVTDANGDSLAVCYNPMNYIVRMNEKGSADLQNLLKALYNYHLAAKALQETV